MRKGACGNGTFKASRALRNGRGGRGEAYDCAFLEPLALPPDLPPPVILIEVLCVVVKVGDEVELVRDVRGRLELCFGGGCGWKSEMMRGESEVGGELSS